MFVCVAGRWHFVEFLPEHFDSSVETIDWLEEEDGGGCCGVGGGGVGGGGGSTCGWVGFVRITGWMKRIKRE